MFITQVKEAFSPYLKRLKAPNSWLHPAKLKNH